MFYDIKKLTELEKELSENLMQADGKTWEKEFRPFWVNYRGDIPKCLMDQLSPAGGILLSPVKKNDKQYLKSIEKNDEIISEKIHGTVNFVPLLEGTD